MRPVRVRVRRRSRPEPEVRVRVRVRRVREDDGIRYYAYWYNYKSAPYLVEADTKGVMFATNDMHFKAAFTRQHRGQTAILTYMEKRAKRAYTYDELKDKLLFWEAAPEHREAHGEYMKRKGRLI